MRDTKQVIVIRRDLKMRRGKEIAQGAHAAMAWLTRRIRRSFFGFNRLSESEQHWLNNSFRKITIQVDTLGELLAIRDTAALEDVICEVIEDSGTTEFHGVPTITCLAIGPDWSDRVDKITAGLKLY
jgi:PTH2 family peptidyl-tRNA hydrolase